MTDTASAGRGQEEDGRDVALLCGGDEAAFGRLYRRHGGRVEALARWLVGPADAVEAAQDVWVRVWEQAASVRGAAGFGTWLHRVAVSVLLRFRERRGREQQRHVELEGDAVPERATRGDVVLRMELDEAVAALPPRARDVFVLHDVLGFRAPEIAASLGITELTVRSHVARARLSLRQRLGPDLDGGES
jgi:RNA polymerase sigma-70 factor, ECF subfamily